MYIKQLFYSSYTIDIKVVQMRVGKQWMKSWGMYRWVGEGSEQRGLWGKEQCIRTQHFITKQVARAENGVYT